MGSREERSGERTYVFGKQLTPMKSSRSSDLGKSCLHLLPIREMGTR
jgi:hypothetical protein